MNQTQLLTIPELGYTGEAERMSEENLSIYVDKLKWFIDELPLQEMQLKEALRFEDYDAMSKILTHIWDMLIKIYADSLAEECFRHVKLIRSLRNSNVMAGITLFTTKLSALSIDIQMAFYKDSAGVAEQVQESIPDQAAEPAARPSSAEEKPKDSKDNKPCVLAVDDAAFHLNSLNSFFKNSPYTLICARSGQAALNYLKVLKPDLFILDIDMPEMNGYELAGKIKERGHTSPILFLTGNSQKDSVIKAIQAGASDFIVKPITKEQVFDRVNKFIGCPEPVESVSPEEPS